MNQDLERINTALSRLYPDSDPIFELVEELMDFKSSFEFSTGGNNDLWQGKTSAISTVCGNCGFKWISGFLPMPSYQLRKVLERAGFCVRCCEAEKVYFQEVVVTKPKKSVKTQAAGASIGSMDKGTTSSKMPIFRHANG